MPCDRRFELNFAAVGKVINFVLLLVALLVATAVAAQAAVPTVTSVSPSIGETTGGATVTLTGTDFTGATGISFGAATATNFVVNSDTSISVVAPAVASTGVVDITVTTPGGTSSTSSADHFNYVDTTPPAVTLVSPANGSTTGNTTPTISGTAEPNSTVTVMLDGSTAGTATLDGGGNWTFTPTNALSFASHTVQAIAADASNNTANSSVHTFTIVGPPTVTFASPFNGPTTGGTSVVITGTNFSGATAVNFGGTTAAFTVNSATQITATAPSGSSGAVDITVTTAGGTSAVSGSDKFFYFVPPTVTSISPTSGPAAGGTSVVITGTNFSGATGQAVKFGGVSALSFTVNSDTQITATAPANNGIADVTVTTPGGTSSASAGDKFTYLPAPVVTSVSPNSGLSSGGATVTIAGNQFSGVTAVTFGTTAATSFTVNSTSSITATVPAGTGLVDVRVTSAGGTSAIVAGDRYTYISVPVITSISPSSGPNGTTVTIQGTGFTGFTSIKFGTVSVSSAGGNSTTISTVAPAGTGTVDITITNSAGTSATSSADLFTYTNRPTVSSLSSSGGAVAGGNSITITGKDFTGVTAVSFGGKPATSYTVNSTTSITAVVPAGLSTGTVDVLVSNANGASLTSSADHYTYGVVPAVTSISPTLGPVGTMVTITGTDFVNVTGVKFGTVSATSGSQPGPTVIMAVAPANTGTVDITITNGVGTSATSTVDQFTYVFPPTVTAISPGSGPTAGGTSVTLTGTNLAHVTAVSFGGTAATGFTINSETSITATAPAGTGTVDVTVTNAAATSATSSADQFTYNGAMAVTTNPTDQTINAGQTATFTVAASGTPTPTVQWQFSSDGGATFQNVAGATTTTLTVPNVAAGQNGTKFRAVFTNSTGSATTSAATLTVDFAPSVTTNPSSTSVVAGNTTTFTAAANGNPLATVQWQQSTDGGATFQNIAGATATTLSFTAGSGQNGNQYRAVFTNSVGSATTTAATLTVQFAPTVTSTSPTAGPTAGGTVVTITGSNFTGATAVRFGGTSATSFTVNSSTSITATTPAGTGTVDITVTAPGGTSSTSAADQFTFVSAPAVTSLSVTSGSTAGGTTVVITGANFSGVTAVRFGAVRASSFTVNSASQITAVAPAGTGTTDVTVTTTGGTSPTGTSDQYTYVVPPVAGAVTASVVYNSSNNPITLSLSGGAADSVAIGTAPSHGSVTTSGTSITYTPATNYVGSDSFTYTVTNVSGTSTPATVSLTVTAPALTTTQVVAATTLTTGTAATSFTPVTASGGAGTLSYALSGGTLPAGLTFDTATGQISGTPTAILATTTFTVTVSDQAQPTAQTSAQTFALTVNAVPMVTTNPANVTVTAGATATFTTAASGTPTPTIQWETSTDNGVTFIDIPGATALSYSFATTSVSQSGTQFRAVFTNSAGVATTSAATLTVNAAITVANNPADASVYEGQLVSFTAAATGTPTPSIHWQKKLATASAFSDIAGVTATTLTFQAALSDDGSQYRAVFSNTTGTVMTTAATLTVKARPDPSKDAEVVGVVNAETQTAFQFADQQVTNFDERLDQLHADGYAGSSNNLHLGFGFGTDNLTDEAMRHNMDRLTGHDDAYALNTGLPSQDDDWMAPHQSGPNIEGQDTSPPQGSALTPAPGSRFGTWIGGALTFGERDPTTRRASFKFRSSGLSLGADMRVNDKLSLGLGLGLNDDTSKIGTLGTRVTSQGTFGVIYGNVRPGGTSFVDFVLAQGAIDFDSHRAITGAPGQFADGSRKASEGFASVKAGWDWTDGSRNAISPYGRVTIINGHLDPFTETTGGSMALSYQKQSLESLNMAFGGKASRNFAMADGTWTPSVTVEYAHEFKDSEAARMSYADWIGGPTYSAVTDPYYRDRFVTGLGASFNSGSFNFNFDYRHNIDSGSAQSDTLTTRLNMKF